MDALASLPARSLERLTIAVRVQDAADAMARLAPTGATLGVVVAPFDDVSTDVLRRTAVLIVPAVHDSAEAVFWLRMLTTSARAARPGVRVLLDAPEIPEHVAPYVDGKTQRHAELVAPTADALVAASLQGGSDPLTIRVTDVDPRAVAAFASQQALESSVVAAAPLRVGEIVARHQAQRRRQEQLVQRTIARGTTSLLFEVPGFVAPVTVTAETIIYAQPGIVELEQRDIRVNGAAIAGGSASSPPQLPLIEAERVATPPLTITLNEAYRYELAGREQIDGTDAYVVKFESLRLPAKAGSYTNKHPAGSDKQPVGSDKNPGPFTSLARGRAWIDANSFSLRRLETIQSGLRGAIVSSEQHEHFGSFPAGGETVWLPVRTQVFQMYEGAGHRTPIHRTIATPQYEINPEDFDTQLQAAHTSPHLMLRETPQGFRYLLRDPGLPTSSARVVAPRAGERIRTVVFGILIDPNISVPLPFAGVSYVDLNLFNTGAQLNAFFGGSYGQLSWSVPALGGTRWQAHGRAFGIAAKYHDRAFRGGVEQYRENIMQRPAHASAGLVRPLTHRVRARIDYELDYTAFDRADTTGATFVVPADAIVHGLVAAIEAETGPWSARIFWNPASRGRWKPWGDGSGDGGGNDVDKTRAFQRFGTVVARTLALGPTVGSRVEGAWMDGADLDRFSRYGFNAFDNRLHGYPTASLRYDRGGVIRSVTSWSARGWRVDAFADMAVVRDPGFGRALRGYPGVGAALEAAGPLRTLWSVEWGYGFRARREDGGTGTQAVRVTGYRNF